MHVIDRHGRRKEIDDDYVLEDGEKLVIGSVSMMDARAREALEEEEDNDDEKDPAAAADAAYHERNAWLSDAWRNPHAEQVPAADARASDADAAYDERTRDLENAWRNP